MKSADSKPGRTSSGWACSRIEVSISPACMSVRSEVTTPDRARAASQSSGAGKSAIRSPRAEDSWTALPRT
ncbi:hypothetical protein AQJ64_03330 [Streptomyces griseoruber]|uniref:Uncharacterized protein n=1 Tax=Streptomyces griseoruber TaxID=1943 RepID=A0A101T9H4_9ACTN|nr:hypothetical protein AQJ64_03330 [Streptomyces griseoruber]